MGGLEGGRLFEGCGLGLGIVRMILSKVGILRGHLMRMRWGEMRMNGINEVSTDATEKLD